jgi:YHS domain-containing protein
MCGEKVMKGQRSEKVHRDPVCGMEVSRTTAAEELVHEGRTYYFCAPACREAFEAEPERYRPRHRQHGVKPR